MDSDLNASEEASGPQKSIKRLNERPTSTSQDKNAQNDNALCESGSPLEDGEIEDEDADVPVPEVSAAVNSKRPSDVVDGKCSSDTVPMKRALGDSCNKEYVHKGRRLNADSEISRFHRPAPSSKSITRAARISSAAKPTYMSRTENASSAVSTVERQWNSAANDQRNNVRSNRQHRKQTPVCRFFVESRCNKGAECTFSHDVQPIKRYELCKFYLNGFCVKHDHCNFMHSDFPCKFFHGPHGECASASQCRFSHDPITDARVKTALEKVLSESSGDAKSSTAPDWEQGKTRQATPGQSSKPSLLGSPPDATQCRQPSASKPPCPTENYYKESILSAEPAASPSEPTEKPGEDCLRRPIHQRAVPRPMYPTSLPPMSHDAFGNDLRNGPSRFQGQWTMSSGPLPSHRPGAPRHCPESIRQPSIFPPFARVQSHKFAGPSLPRMRIPGPPPPPGGQRFPPVDPPMHWMSTVPNAMRYRYPWTPPQRMPPSRQPLEPVEPSPPNENEGRKYTTLQDLINAIGLEPPLKAQNRFAAQPSNAVDQSVCARLEELIRSMQSKKDVKETVAASQETPVARIEPKTGPFVYRLFKIDLSGIHRAPKGGALTLDENSCRDPRIRNELKNQNRDPRLLDAQCGRPKSRLCASRPTDPRLAKNHSDIR